MFRWLAFLLLPYVIAGGGLVRSVAESCKVAGGKKVGICSAFGFDGIVGTRMFDALFDATLKEQGIIVAKSSDVIDIVEMGGSNVAVGFFKAVQLRGDATDLQAIVQALIEEAMMKSSTGQTTIRKQLLILLETDPAIDEDAQKVKMLELVAEAWSLLPQHVEGKSLDSFLDITVYPIPRGADLNVVLSSIRSKVFEIITQNEGQFTTGLEAAARLNKQADSITAGTARASANELLAVAACTAVSHDFIRDVKARISSLIKAPVIPSPGLPVADIISTIAAALEDNYKMHASVFNTYANSDALKAASYQTRAALTSVVQPLYRRAVESLRASNLKVFDSVMLRVPPNKRLPQVLRAQAAAVQSNFLLKSEDLRTEFSGVFKGVDGPSLLSGGSWVHRGGPGAKAISTSGSAWAVGCELRILRSQLAESCAERERFLFLQGSYNPFIRDMPFPPTKFSFHYLLDPRAMVFSRDYCKLYDEHMDGPAVSRANPLIIPGVAINPFDPNDLPMPKDEKKWWQVVMDYYKNDS